MIYNLFDDFNPKIMQLVLPTELNFDDATHGVRRVEYYEVELISSGDGRISVDGKEHKTYPHSLHFRQPSMIVEGRGQYRSRYFSFVQDQSSSATDGLVEMPVVYRLNSDEFERINALFDLMFFVYYNDTFAKNITQKRIVLEIMETMLYNWHHATQSQVFDTQTIRNMQKAINYIHDNFRQKIEIENISEHLGYSVSYFSRVFKKYTAWPPLQYLNNYRMVMAKKLLVETDETIDAVGADCGFNNPIYFYRVFKKITGSTPNQFRKNHRGI